MNELSLAIIEENCEQIAHLVDTFPSIQDTKEAKQALVLIIQAQDILEKAKRDSFNHAKIKQTKRFLLNANEAKTLSLHWLSNSLKNGSQTINIYIILHTIIYKITF